MPGERKPRLGPDPAPRTPPTGPTDGTEQNHLQLKDRDLGIDGRGVQLGVRERLLDKPDVGPALQNVRRAGVAQEGMRSKNWAYSALLLG